MFLEIPETSVGLILIKDFHFVYGTIYQALRSGRIWHKVNF